MPPAMEDRYGQVLTLETNGIIIYRGMTNMHMSRDNYAQQKDNVPESDESGGVYFNTDTINTPRHERSYKAGRSLRKRRKAI